MTQKITFIIAPVGCAFHHIGPICQAIGATFFIEIAAGVNPADFCRLIENRNRHQAVFTKATCDAIKAVYPDAEIIAYYDACRRAGVSPFHTGTGQIIGPLNHAASLAGSGAYEAAARQLQEKTFGLTERVTAEIIKEREHQRAKGYDASQDDLYTSHELPRAAIVYALKGNGVETSLGRKMYPWNKQTFKDEGPRANLIKAAALLVAEIERMDREDATRGCSKAVDGYQCSRAAGHEGPCAAFIQSFDND